MSNTTNRRHFMFGTLALPGSVSRASAASKRKILLILVDGFGPEYLEKSEMPNLKSLGKRGGLKTGSSVIPSVTNVNNASLVTGCFPEEHGITTNYQYDRRTKAFSEMESSEYLLRPTIFEKARKFGLRTALVTSKDKVRTLCARGADLAVSAEMPDPAWIQKIGQKESMYSAAVNYWTFRAARYILNKESVDLMYLSTTDYMMHTYAPDEAPSLEHLHTLDKLLGDIASDHPELEVYLTADHGMNAKTEGLNPAIILREKSIAAEAVPIIRDKHQVHHKNLGGACYIYLERRADQAKATELLKRTEGVEEVFDARAAAREFHLHPDRIGDLFLLARKEFAFGELPKARESIRIRSHGSRHESHVPLVAYGGKVDMSRYAYNLDLSRKLDLGAKG
jgi:phosphonoacetate hydrolase